MTRVIFVALCSLCLLLVESVISLKCRNAGIQQVDDQFQKIAQICKRRYTSNDDYNDNFSSSNDEDDSSSMDVFDIIFFSGSKSSNAQSWKDQNDHRDHHENNQKNGNNQRYFFNVNNTNGNSRNGRYPNHDRGNDRDFSYSDRTNYNRMYNDNSENDNKEQEQACIVQCVFNELNVVDQRGFPEQHSIIQLMTHNIHNPEMQDFVEEAVIECFHYLNSDRRQENCRFSQNLLTCLADKEKERCEDFDN